jgi:hypothetical protein
LSLDGAKANMMGVLGMVIVNFMQGTNAYKLYLNMQLPGALYDWVKFWRPPIAQHHNYRPTEPDAH